MGCSSSKSTEVAAAAQKKKDKDGGRDKRDEDRQSADESDGTDHTLESEDDFEAEVQDGGSKKDRAQAAKIQ